MTGTSAARLAAVNVVAFIVNGRRAISIMACAYRIMWFESENKNLFMICSKIIVVILDGCEPIRQEHSLR